MTKEFYSRLKEYYNNVGSVLRDQASISSIFPNKTDIGLSREGIYAEFLKSHLPNNCHVFLGGFLFNMEGTESKQIDLFVASDSSLQFNFADQGCQGKAFACIDGTLAVASLKSNLDSTNLNNALENLASIPDKQPLNQRANPLIKIPDYDDWPYKIIFAPNGVSLSTLESSIDEFYRDHPSIPFTKRPNMIHVAGKYNIVRTTNECNKLRNGTTIPANSFYGQEDPTDVYALLCTIENIQKKALAAQHILFTYHLLDNINF